MRADVTTRRVDDSAHGGTLRLGSARAAVAAMVLFGAACGDKTIEAYPTELAGIGVVLKSAPDGFVVGSVVDGGPAGQAGIKEGDRVVEIDGQPTEGRSLASVVDSLRGKDGSQVLVRVASGGASTEVVTLKRRVMRKAAEGYQARQ